MDGEIDEISREFATFEDMLAEEDRLVRELEKRARYTKYVDACARRIKLMRDLLKRVPVLDKQQQLTAEEDDSYRTRRILDIEHNYAKYVTHRVCVDDNFVIRDANEKEACEVNVSITVEDKLPETDLHKRAYRVSYDFVDNKVTRATKMLDERDERTMIQTAEIDPEEPSTSNIIVAKQSAEKPVENEIFESESNSAQEEYEPRLSKKRRKSSAPVEPIKTKRQLAARRRSKDAQGRFIKERSSSTTSQEGAAEDGPATAANPRVPDNLRTLNFNRELKIHLVRCVRPSSVDGTAAAVLPSKVAEPMSRMTEISKSDNLDLRTMEIPKAILAEILASQISLQPMEIKNEPIETQQSAEME